MVMSCERHWFCQEGEGYGQHRTKRDFSPIPASLSFTSSLLPSCFFLVTSCITACIDDHSAFWSIASKRTGKKEADLDLFLFLVPFLFLFSFSDSSFMCCLFAFTFFFASLSLSCLRCQASMQSLCQIGRTAKTGRFAVRVQVSTTLIPRRCSSLFHCFPFLGFFFFPLLWNTAVHQASPLCVRFL